MMKMDNRLRNIGSKRLSRIALALAVGVLVAGVSIPGCQRSSDVVVNSADSASVRDEIGNSNEDIHIVSLPSLGLEAAIREAIGKPTGDIYNTDLEGMKYLDASGRSISNLEGIQNCVDLEWIELGDNEIIDISALSSLTNLKALGLKNNQIVDISMLSGLTNLWLLDLSNNQIVDIASLVNNARIGLGDIVSLRGNQLLRQSGSQNMLDIETLQRRGVNVLFKDAVVVSFPDLGLEAAIRKAIGKPTGDIYDIYLIGLTFLDAKGRGISNLEGIRHCGGLEKLLLSDNKIVDFSPLSGLANLRWIDLGDSDIVDITELSRLTNLTELWLPNNEIVDISALSGLTNLRTLYLSHNEIIDISPLSGLTGLWLLGLDDNEIVDISVLSGLTNLEMVILGDNEIADISVLSGLTNLVYLYLSHNEIADISALSGLTNLKTLSLDINQIADILPLVDNSGLGSLDWVDLRYNDLDLTRGSPDMNDIEALRGRGADVDFDPQN